MASSVDIHRAGHEAFNARDWDSLRDVCANDVAYSDRPRNLELRSVDEFLGWTNDWVTGMSDARVTEPEYLEAGEYSVCRFIGQGTNDGPLGPAQATGKAMNMPFCEIMRVQDGKIVSGEIFYDQLTMMSQFGLMEAPAPA
jgi:ketosteroid isomerase-like protein